MRPPRSQVRLPRWIILVTPIIGGTSRSIPLSHAPGRLHHSAIPHLHGCQITPHAPHIKCFECFYFVDNARHRTFSAVTVGNTRNITPTILHLFSTKRSFWTLLVLPTGKPSAILRLNVLNVFWLVDLRTHLLLSVCRAPVNHHPGYSKGV